MDLNNETCLLPPFLFAHKIFSEWARHSFTTRLLASIMPSKIMAKRDRTLDDMNRFMVDDLTFCYHNGVKASGCMFPYPHSSTMEPLLCPTLPPGWRKVKGQTFHFIYVGCKGDWPYLRKMMGLASGFRSLRLCHLCNEEDSQLYRPFF